MSGIENESIAVSKANNDIKSCNIIFTVPNIISFLRIIFIIPFIIFFSKKEYIIAFSFIVLSGISDCLDGFLARKLNQVSELGKMLDPVADKLTLVVVIICLGTIMPPIIPLVSALVIKDISMLLGGYYLIRKGKLATIIFYISVCTIVFCRAFLHYENAMLVLVLLSITVAAMIFALVKYAAIFVRLIRKGSKY